MCIITNYANTSGCCQNWKLYGFSTVLKSKVRLTEHFATGFMKYYNVDAMFQHVKKNALRCINVYMYECVA